MDPMRAGRSTACRLTLISILTILPGAAGADDDVEVRTIRESLPLAGAAELSLDLPVGAIEVRGGSGEAVDLDLTLRCDEDEPDCPEEARRIEATRRRAGSRLEVALGTGRRERPEGMSVHGTISVPASLRLSVEMGVGELTVRGMEADLSLDLGVGELVIELSAGGVRSIELEAGVGETSLRTPGGRIEETRSHLVGSELEWREGTGASEVSAEVGVGQISVRLEE